MRKLMQQVTHRDKINRLLLMPLLLHKLVYIFRYNIVTLQSSLRIIGAHVCSGGFFNKL
jgi:hypothetical protein